MTGGVLVGDNLMDETDLRGWASLELIRIRDQFWQHMATTLCRRNDTGN